MSEARYPPAFQLVRVGFGAVGRQGERHCGAAVLVCVLGGQTRPERSGLRDQAWANRRTPAFRRGGWGAPQPSVQ
jgi:hypothetical protein